MAQSYGYDANGNLTARGSQAFSFDIGNRLSSAPGKASYAYDGHGRRTWVAYADGSWKLQVYGSSGRLLFTGHSSQGNTRHVYLGSRLIAEYNTLTGTSYSHIDALGSPVARTNSAGQVTSRTRYEPYGATAAGTNPTGIGFTGHVNDADTGLVYMQQRYYEPLAGRFLSVDPVVTDGKDGSFFNRYVYAANNPYEYTDPDGRLFLPAMALGGAAGALLNAGVQLYRAGGDFSRVSLPQVGVAFVVGALGGGAGVIANQAASTAGMVGANFAAGGAIGAVGTHVSSVVDTGKAAGVRDVVNGALAGGALSGAAGAVGAAPTAGARAAAGAMSQTERTSTGNLIKGMSDATKGAGGSGTWTAPGQGAANAAGATLANADNVRTSEPKAP